MGAQKEKKVSQDEALKEAEKQLEAQKKQKLDAETKSEKGTGKKEKTKSKKPARPHFAKASRGKRKIRSQKYKKAYEQVDRDKRYRLEDAIELAKKTSYSRFEGSIELHIRILKSGKQFQPIRQLISLPHGTGKKLNIIVLDEAKIDEIVKTKKTDFDICLATPQIMPKIAKIAKILGPHGKMPNPKSGSITTEPEKTKKELESGKLEIKEDAKGIIHQLVGKTSWDSKKIKENVEAILKYIPVSKLQSITICATMGPGIKIQI